MNTSTIKSMIEAGKGMQNTANDFHFKHVIENSKGEKFIVNMNALFEKYYSLMLDNAVMVTLSNEDYHKYRYKPKIMSLDLYGTTELYFLLLRLNNMVSVTQFDRTELKVFDQSIVKILNEISIHEYENFVDNDLEVIRKINE